MAALVGGAALGAPFAVLLDAIIAEAKKVRAFKSLFKNLASTMESLIPIAKEIDSMYDKLDLQKKELKDLIDTIGRAQKLVRECSQIWWFDIYSKSRYSSKIKKIDQDFLRFLQINIQLLIFENLLKTMCSMKSVHEKIDRMRSGGNQFTDLCSAPEPERVAVGLNRPLMELKEKLFDDGTSAVVVSAPPGCGKTTLVTKLCHDEQVKGKFEKIFFIVVSKTPNVRLIVQKLLRHNGYEVPPLVNKQEAIFVLKKLLKLIGENSSMLVVLDDVWVGAESLLDAFAVESPNYKILVTSRSEFPSFGPTYSLEPLKDEDAKTLLINWAGKPNFSFSSEFEDLLQKILKRCNGFPLAIEVVGSSLKGKSLSSWKGLAEKWAKGDKIVNTPHPKVLECFQPSIDALGTALKDCFLDMGSFLEDQKIRASTICDLWVELYRRGEYDALANLEDLSSQNLLKLVTLGRNGHEDGFFNEYMVTQHDILRKLAIHNSELEEIPERKRLNLEIQDDTFPDWCLDLSQPFKARLLSICTDDSFSSEWVDMDFPEVEALVLNISTLNYGLPGFIAKMEKLKLLTVTNHGFFPAEVSNFSCFRSLPNLRRIRLEKASISLLDVTQLRLPSLEKLSMVMCDFGEVYYELEIDISGSLPRLREIDIDYCIDLDELPFWICKVVSLKKLSISNCNKLATLPEAMSNLRNLEVLRLRSCIYLSELPESITGLGNLSYLDVCDCIGLRRLPLQIGGMQKLKKISMTKCGRCELPDSIRDLENLEVKCDEETEVMWERFKPVMRNLTVHVEECKHSLNWLKNL
ncbi:PREDICTED: probable disease resistance protein At5g66900 [Tarenaya hassleriana]|uniref:probable disease resistance protein At5g66900 n=1 Tax=Tarenaya hassleriana TaxID=28532 RepID=UPI00053C4961|nr:PREDICTED: probable disease resistance protein At5g66900 [Tarenaya hassleriana]